MDGRKRAGLFISFEGSEGCGKSTQIGLLCDWLEQAGATVTRVREPGGTALGEEVRHLLKHSAAGEGMCAEAEILLFSASRAQLVREVVAPALEGAAGVVVADRFVDSTTVYQGLARGLDLAEVRAINHLATAGILPDLTIVLDLPVETARARLDRRGEARDRLEREEDAFFERVRRGYLELAKAEPGRILVLDGAEDPATVHARVCDAIRSIGHATFR